MELTVVSGLPERLREQAAALYWAAFGDKLGRVLGPPEQALIFLNRVIRADQCFVALDGDGRLQGLAGFKTPEGSFAGGTATDLRAVYGPLGAFWRETVLSLLGSEVDHGRFLLDGICVAEAARGKGVGTALLAAIAREAVRRGFSAVRLEVVDSNRRARALYEREGFVAGKSARLGLLRHLFGFAEVITMVQEIRAIE